MAHTAKETGVKEQRSQGGGQDTMESCIEACTSCHRACLETARACLQMGGKHAGADHVTLLLDCAQICATSADFMERGSAYHVVTCSACAEICRACARSCREMGGEAMERCAQACDACAESCEEMAKHVRVAAAHH